MVIIHTSHLTAHPPPPQASTVRQKCSLFFQTLLSSSPPQLLPVLARLTLQSLHAGWHVDAASLAQLQPAPSPSHQTASHHPRSFPDPPSCTGAASPSGIDVAGVAPGRSWQWREGRLLALELVYQIVLQRHEVQAAGICSGEVRCSVCVCVFAQRGWGGGGGALHEAQAASGSGFSAGLHAKAGAQVGGGRRNGYSVCCGGGGGEGRGEQ